MWSLARQMLRAHRTGFVAAFLTVFCGSALITACGVLLDSGQRGGGDPDRFATPPIVVSAPQTLPIVEDVDKRFTERARVPLARLASIEDTDGVRAAIGDVTVRGGLRTADDTKPLDIHGWGSAQLGGVELTEGRAPHTSNEAVLGVDTGARPGDTAKVEVGGVATTYRIVGLAASGQDQAYLSDARARVLSDHPRAVDAIAVFPDDGVDADELAERIDEAIPEATVATGDARADAEDIDAASARSFLTMIGISFGTTMVLIVVLIVASTLTLSVQQRRRQLALLRAVAATPRQVNRLIVAEATMLSFVAALLGALPGIGLAVWLQGALLDLDIVPPGFELTVGPLPMIASVLCCVVAGGTAGRLAARRANRISPIEALGAASVEPPRLGRVRLVVGWLVVTVGVVTGAALPLSLGGPAALGSVAGSALLMVIGVAIVGPQLLAVATRAAARLGLRRTASGWLASANTHAHSRRLSMATTPLILGITLAAIQMFSQATTDAAADSQVESGLVADRVLVSDDGIAPEVADAARRVPGVTATAVSQTQVMVTYDELGDPVTETYPAQGINPAGVDKTMDLDVSDGDLGELRPGTVALSGSAADMFGVSVGSRLSMKLGDGTPYEARVVAVYERGLGFGDLTLHDDVVRASTTSGLNDYVLLAGGGNDSLRMALAPYREVSVTDRDSFTAAQVDGRAGEDTLGLLLNLALLAFIAIAVVNVFVLATTARVREFALLRLIGAQPRQVRSMMHGEMVTIVGMAVVVGLLAAAPPLVGMSFALTGSALPTMSPLIVGSIVLAAVTLGWCAISLPTRYALRTAPITAMEVGE